jgi:putative flippase GtrA
VSIMEEPITSAPAPIQSPMGGAGPSGLLVGSGGGLSLRLRTLLANREVRRVAAYLFAGGVSAIVTISTTAALEHLVQALFAYAAIAGTELGILVNFAFNDRQAFRDLDGHHRAWPVRLVRYHVTCAAGQTLILLISLVLHDLEHWPGVFAQALPIGLVTIFNFLMHRFWTYRGSRHKG